MKKALLILPLFLFFSPISFAQSNVDEKVTNNPEIAAISDQVTDFDNFDYEKRKELFPILKQKIDALVESPQKQLLLANLLAQFPGEKQENASKAIAIAESIKKKGNNLYEANCIIANAYLAKLGLAFLLSSPSEWKDVEDIELREKAIKSIDNAIFVDKQGSEAYRIKAELVEGDEQIELFEKSIRFDNSNNRAWRGLIQKLTVLKRYDEALRRVLLWLQNDLSDEYKIEAYLRTGRIFRDRKELEVAISWFLKAEILRNSSSNNALDQRYSGSDEIYRELANTYFESKDYSNAEIYYKKYLDLKPSDSYVRFDLARLYADSGQKDNAIVEYNQVLAYNASNTSAIYNLGLLYSSTEPEKAKELFRKYIDLEKDHDWDEARKWVSNAKSQLMSLGVYEFPKSKKELAAEKKARVDSWFRGVGVLVIFGFIVYLAVRFRKITKWLIIVAMLIAVVCICLYEADNGANLGRAFLYFIPVLSTGGFLLYILKPKKPKEN